MTPGPMMLLQNAGVQKELSISVEQQSAVRNLFGNLQSRFQGELRNAGGASAELRKKLAAAAWEGLPAILRPEQQQRLREIELQARGVEALIDPSIQQVLNLTEEQQNGLRAVFEELQADVARLRKSGSAPVQPQEARAKAEALRREAQTRALAILTDSQNASFRRSLGAPFDLQLSGARPQPRPGRQRGPDSRGAPDLDDL